MLWVRVSLGFGLGHVWVDSFRLRGRRPRAKHDSSEALNPKAPEAHVGPSDPLKPENKMRGAHSQAHVHCSTPQNPYGSLGKSYRALVIDDSFLLRFLSLEHPASLL